MLGDIDYFLRDLSRGMGRIQNGQIPDGSGNPIGNNGTLTDYWFKPGISDPFTAFMSTGPGAGGLISSTADSRKGIISLGDTAVVDEGSGYVGINRTAPHVALDVRGTANATGGAILPNSDRTGGYNDTGPGGWAPSETEYYTGAGTPLTGSHFGALSSNDGTTSWLGRNGGGTSGIINGENPERLGLGGVIVPGATYNVTVSMFALGASPDSGNFKVTLVDSNGDRWDSAVMDLNGLPTTPTTYILTVTCSGSSPGTDTPNGLALTGTAALAVATGIYVCVSYVAISGLEEDIQHWHDSDDNLLSVMNKDGRLGLGITSTLQAMSSLACDDAATVGAIFRAASAQTADLAQFQSSTPATLSGFTAAGKYYLTSGAGVHKVLVSDASGVGSWTALSALTATFTDSLFSIIDNADATKTLKFELGGATAGADLTIGLSSTADRALNFSLAGSAGNDLTLAWAGTGDRTITIPDQDGTLPTINNATNITGPWSFDVQGTDETYVLSVPGGHAGQGSGGFYVKDVVSGFAAEIAPLGAGFTADRILTLPDASDTLVTLSSVQTLQNKTLKASSSVLESTNSTTGVRFQDTTTSTKRLRFVLSGAVGDNVMSLSNTAARTYTFPNDTGTVAIIAAPSAAATDLTGKTGAVTAATIYTTTHAGFFQMEAYTVITAFTAGGTITVDATWTDPAATNTNVTFSTFAYTAVNQNSFVTGTGPHRVSFYATSGSAIQVRTTFSGTATYSTYVRLTALT